MSLHNVKINLPPDVGEQAFIELARLGWHAIAGEPGEPSTWIKPTELNFLVAMSRFFRLPSQNISTFAADVRRLSPEERTAYRLLLSEHLGISLVDE